MVLSVIGIAKCLFNHFRGTKPAQLGMLLSFFTLQGLVSNADGGQYEPRGPDIQSQAVGQAMQAETSLYPKVRNGPINTSLN